MSYSLVFGCTMIIAAAATTATPIVAERSSLDALHLASALQLGDDLDGIVTYDQRLADAAVHLAIPVVSPS